MATNIDFTDYRRELGGETIQVGESETLLGWEPDKSSENFETNRNDIRQRLSNLTIKLTYTDMRKKDEFTCSRNLDWFGRILPKKSSVQSRHDAFRE
jgi:hypothetical protein